MKLLDEIYRHFVDTNKTVPDIKGSILFAVHEVGEACDVVMDNTGTWNRNHPERHEYDDHWEHKFALECGHAIMMLMVAASCVGCDAIDVLLDSFEEVRRGRSE